MSEKKKISNKFNEIKRIFLCVSEKKKQNIPLTPEEKTYDQIISWIQQKKSTQNISIPKKFEKNLKQNLLNKYNVYYIHNSSKDFHQKKKYFFFLKPFFQGAVFASIFWIICLQGINILMITGILPQNFLWKTNSPSFSSPITLKEPVSFEKKTIPQESYSSGISFESSSSISGASELDDSNFMQDEERGYFYEDTLHRDEENKKLNNKYISDVPDMFGKLTFDNSFEQGEFFQEKRVARREEERREEERREEERREEEGREERTDEEEREEGIKTHTTEDTSLLHSPLFLFWTGIFFLIGVIWFLGTWIITYFSQKK